MESKKEEIYLNGNGLVLDFETTNTQNGSALVAGNRMVLSAWGPIRANQRLVDIQHVFGSEYEQGRLLGDIKRADFLVAHNAKFELQWLVRCGVDIHEILVWDTMVADKVIRGNRMAPLTLDACCGRHGVGAKDVLGKALVHGGVSPQDVPSTVLAEYCRQDVRITAELFRRQLQFVIKENPSLLPVIYSRCLVTPVLADIEFNGMGVDKDRVNRLYEGYSARKAALDRVLFGICGDCNWDSRPQLASLLYGKLGFQELVDYRGNVKKTPAGSPKTDEKTLLNLEPTTDEQRSFLRAYKERASVSSALSKCLNILHAEVVAGKNVIHAEFHQVRTATGRLSSSGIDNGNGKIQFHNQPRQFKSLYCSSRKGWLIGECDSSQLEFRVAGVLTGDEQIKQDVADKIDVHAMSARMLKVSRQNAKEHTFKPLFGGSSGTKKERAYYEAFRQRYAVCFKKQTEWVHTVLESKKLQTPWGLTFYWPTVSVCPSGYVHHSSEIFNYPIQSFATAEIIPLALVLFWKEIRAAGLQMRIINTVHDSIVVELPPSEVEVFKALARRCMTDGVSQFIKDLYGIELNIPLDVEFKIGKHWGENEEENG